MLPKISPQFCTTLKALLLLITVLAIEGIGPANSASTYFVDANLGDDTRPGEAILTSGTDGPWRSLSRVKAATLIPGDTVILRCGSIWREPLMITGAGNSAASINIRAEDACVESARPEINLAVPLKGWIPVEGTIYVSDASFEVKQVFVDGQPLNKARYPATGFLLAESGIGATIPAIDTTGLVDPDLAGMPSVDVAGIKAYIRTVGWLIEENTVTTISGTQLNFAASTRYPVRKGTGYYLSNKFWMLTYAPGWYWDSLEKKLYINLPDGSSPVAHQVEAVQYDYGIRLTSQPYVNISGIRIRQAGLDGVRVESSIQTNLDNMQVLYSGRDGVVFSSGTNGTIQGNLVHESGRDGIVLSMSSGVKVIGNQVKNSGTTGGPINSLAAINARNSDYADIERNTISGAGYIGIHFSRNSSVINNIVYNTCLVLDDCGAIYSWLNGADTSPLNSVIMGNVVENVMGNRYGNADPFTAAIGIYLDELVNGVQVLGNTVINAERGVLLHNAFNNVIDGNTIAYPRAYGVFVAADNASKLSILSANSISNNTIINKSVVPFFYYLDRIDRDSLEILTGNRYVSTKADNAFVIDHRGVVKTIKSYSPTTIRTVIGKANHGTYLQMVKTAGLLTNRSANSAAFPCNFPLAIDCTNSTDFMGVEINYPTTLLPFSSLVILH